MKVGDIVTYRKKEYRVHKIIKSFVGPQRRPYYNAFLEDIQTGTHRIGHINIREDKITGLEKRDVYMGRGKGSFKTYYKEWH